MKRLSIVFATLSLAIIMLFPQQTNAQRVDQETGITQVNKKIETKEKNQKVYYDGETGETITNLYTITEDGLKPITFEEFKEHRRQGQEEANRAKLEEQLLVNSQPFQIQTVTQYFYTQDTASQIYMASYPVTNPYYCNTGAASCTTSVTISTTQTESYSANVVSEAIKDAVKIGASFTWSTAATLTNTYALTITAGQAGEIRFSPKFNKTVGTLKIYNDGWLAGSQTTTGYSPMKLQTGMLAGDVYTHVW